MKNPCWLLTVVLLASTELLRAQEESARTPVIGTFAGTQVVNAQSIEVVPRKRSFSFMIQHRFGAFGPDELAWKQFAGLDLPANIRFAFQYSPINDAQLEIGRSKNGKTWDLAGKVRLLKQTEEDEMPISVTLVADAALMSDDFLAIGDRYFFADGTTPFAYRFGHRMSYSAQAVIARKFSRSFSLQVAPVSIYRNLVPIGESNHMMALAVAARLKVTTKGSILAEASPVLVGRTPGQERPPVALAYEVATVGHVFQIVLSSSQEIIDQRLYPSAVSRYDEGYMHLGFNIARTLFVKPKRAKS